MTLYVHGSDKTFERAVEVEVKDDGRVIVGIGQPAMYDIEDVLTTTIIDVPSLKSSVAQVLPNIFDSYAKPSAKDISSDLSIQSIAFETAIVPFDKTSLTNSSVFAINSS